MADKIITFAPDWATSVETIVYQPKEERVDSLFPLNTELKHFYLEDKVLFRIAVLSSHEGNVPGFLDAKFRHPEKLDSLIIDKDDGSFLSDHLFIINGQPHKTHFKSFGIVRSVMPYTLTSITFHPKVPPNSPPSPGSSGRFPIKCRICKTTAKALALAIVAAATLPNLPQALVIAVSTYLGETTIIAAAFISSVLGDTADMIAEKLCKKVGLC